MKIPFRTAQQRAQDRLQEALDWRPCFLLWPRRARDMRNRKLQHLVVGRCARRRISRDNDDMFPYVWIYNDRTEVIASKITGTDK